VPTRAVCSVQPYRVSVGQQRPDRPDRRSNVPGTPLYDTPTHALIRVLGGCLQRGCVQRAALPRLRRALEPDRPDRRSGASSRLSTFRTHRFRFLVPTRAVCSDTNLRVSVRPAKTRPARSAPVKRYRTPLYTHRFRFLVPTRAVCSVQPYRVSVSPAKTDRRSAAGRRCLRGAPLPTTPTRARIDSGSWQVPTRAVCGVQPYRVSFRPSKTGGPIGGRSNDARGTPLYDTHARIDSGRLPTRAVAVQPASPSGPASSTGPISGRFKRAEARLSTTPTHASIPGSWCLQGAVCSVQPTARLRQALRPTGPDRQPVKRAEGTPLYAHARIDSGSWCLQGAVCGVRPYPRLRQAQQRTRPARSAAGQTYFRARLSGYPRMHIDSGRTERHPGWLGLDGTRNVRRWLGRGGGCIFRPEKTRPADRRPVKTSGAHLRHPHAHP
jgi:hypothetical protein